MPLPPAGSRAATTPAYRRASAGRTPPTSPFGLTPRGARLFMPVRAQGVEVDMPNDDATTGLGITVTDALDPADLAVITEGLDAYDFGRIGYRDFRRLAVAVRDPRTGKVVGGLWGRSEYGLVYVDWLFLPEDLRGARIGSRVLAMAEDEARRRGCTRIALTTMSVEAPGFYRKQGYDVAATIDCDPPGLTRYYMMKKL